MKGIVLVTLSSVCKTFQKGKTPFSQLLSSKLYNMLLIVFCYSLAVPDLFSGWLAKPTTQTHMYVHTLTRMLCLGSVESL